MRASQRVAGVNQVSSVDESDRLRYAFNASEAREVCRSLGLTIASKAQVESALTQGFQTCRFGWIDEHFAVIPRVMPSPSCGQNKTGLVGWRASVRTPFDVFCFNESDAGTQLKDTTSDSPLTGTGDQEHSRSPSQQDTTLTSDPRPSSPRPHPSPSPSSLSSIISVSRPRSPLTLLRQTQSRVEAEPRPALFFSSTQGSSQVTTKTLLIGITGALLLVITAVLGLAKNRSYFQNWDVRQQEDLIDTEENAFVMHIEEPFKDGQVAEDTLEEGTDESDSLNTSL
ncbi:hypothetical protein NHX12_006329 [Muraenolepis orangiensis]|uniref:Link domain-containing protein n=1 Tax=Muraenolepis orangiensis TaxID=630683 RepID=A0A9Q0IB54_9TELE|nr:hypothetical protein NHX12_006329 [Muraenolepis orangiensis]